MITYSIKELELLSGIKAHTLRIWERRYALLTPERSDTNIRKYGADDLKRLLNVVTLLEHGWKISKASALSEKELIEQVEQIFEINDNISHSFSHYVNAMIVSTLAFDETEFEKLFNSAVHLLGMKNAMLKVMYPFLNRLGLMWSLWKVHPGQEHFASNIIRKKLFIAIDQIPDFQNNPKSFLLFLPEGEYHEIGLLFAQYLLQTAGFKVIYLGQDLPFSSLFSAENNLNTKHLLTFFITKSTKAAINKYFKKLQDSFPDATIYVALNKINASLVEDSERVQILYKPEDLLELIPKLQ